MKSKKLFLQLLFLSICFNAYSQKFFRYKNRFNVLDSSICGAVYNNFQKICDSLSSRIENMKREDFIEDYDFGILKLESANKKECLDIIVTPGNSCCQIFKIYSQKNVLTKKLETKCNSFVTENGVKLGITIKEFFNKYDPRLFEIIYLRDFYILKYKGGLIEEDDDQIYFNYISLYKFRNSRLEAFIFGNFNDHYDFVQSIMNGDSAYKKYNEIYSDDWFNPRKSPQKSNLSHLNK